MKIGNPFKWAWSFFFNSSEASSGGIFSDAGDYGSGNNTTHNPLFSPVYKTGGSAGAPNEYEEINYDSGSEYEKIDYDSESEYAKIDDDLAGGVNNGGYGLVDPEDNELDVSSIYSGFGSEGDDDDSIYNGFEDEDNPPDLPKRNVEENQVQANNIFTPDVETVVSVGANNKVVSETSF